MKKYNLIPVLLSSSLLLTSGTLFPCEAYAEAQVLSDVSTDDTREEKISLIGSMLAQAIAIAGDSGTSGSDSASEGLLLSTLKDACSVITAESSLFDSLASRVITRLDETVQGARLSLQADADREGSDLCFTDLAEELSEAFPLLWDLYGLDSFLGTAELYPEEFEALKDAALAYADLCLPETAAENADAGTETAEEEYTESETYEESSAQTDTDDESAENINTSENEHASSGSQSSEENADSLTSSENSLSADETKNEEASALLLFLKEMAGQLKRAYSAISGSGRNLLF